MVEEPTGPDSYWFELVSTGKVSCRNSGSLLSLRTGSVQDLLAGDRSRMLFVRVPFRVFHPS